MNSANGAKCYAKEVIREESFHKEDRCLITRIKTIEKSQREIKFAFPKSAKVAPEKFKDPVECYKILKSIDLNIPFIDNGHVSVKKESINLKSNPHCFAVDGKWSIGNKIYNVCI